MSLNVELPRQADRTVIEMIGEPGHELEWAVLAYLGQYLWQNFGLELDCDRLEIHLVYGAPGGEDDAEGGARSAGESTGP